MYVVRYLFDLGSNTPSLQCTHANMLGLKYKYREQSAWGRYNDSKNSQYNSATSLLIGQQARVYNFKLDCGISFESNLNFCLVGTRPIKLGFFLVVELWTKWLPTREKNENKQRFSGGNCCCCLERGAWLRSLPTPQLVMFAGKKTKQKNPAVYVVIQVSCVFY